MPTEILQENAEVELGTLNLNEVLHVNATDEDGSFSYTFKIVESGERPVCELTQTGPDGSVIGPVPAKLEGSGRWTTPKQNPTQTGDPLMGKPHQWEALSIAWGRVYVGGLLVVSNPKNLKDRVYLMPQATELRLEK